MEKTRTISKPSWFKVRIPSGEKFSNINSLMKKLNLHSVCEEALCPNRAECWGLGTATFLVMGDECTRSCRFCSIKTNPQPMLPDINEPKNIALAVKELSLKYLVLTSVDRDDLSDLGSRHFAECIMETKKLNPGCKVEVLTPDFQGKKELINTVVEAKPDVFAHNIEVVERLQSKMRDARASYKTSLSVLKEVKETDSLILTKSSVMLGFGETKEEVLQLMDNLRVVDCDFLTIGQYLQPTKNNLPVINYLEPKLFDELKQKALSRGFKGVVSGPLVRSSYMAHKLFYGGKHETKL